MPVPSLVTDLSTTIASNSPAGSDNVFPSLDDYLRALSGFLASIRDNSGNGWVSPYLTAANPSYTGTLTGGTGVVNLGSGQLYKDASGLVGIGTSSLSRKLSINDASTPYIAYQIGAVEKWVGGVDASSRWVLYDSTAASNRLMIDAGGNIGAGVTPSAWSGAALQLQTNASLYGFSNTTNVGQNAYYNAGWKYMTTAAAALAQVGQGAHYWFTAPSGTAGNAITFTQSMTLDASGNLGVGGVPIYKLDVLDASAATVRARTTSSGNATLIASTAAGGTALLELTNAAGSHFIYGGLGGTQNISFSVASAERARIDSSGNLLVGTTSSALSNTNSIITATLAGGLYVQHSSAAVSGTIYEGFVYNGTAIGTISQSGTTAVLYNTTSDQRLKTNIVDAPDAAALIDSIQVRSFDWIADDSHQRYGMVAQELFKVAPEAVHAPADPDAMMAVDYSKLVPMLVKEIQSLRARVAALEA